MMKMRLMLVCLVCVTCSPGLRAQQQPAWHIESSSGAGGGVVYDFRTGVATATNGVLIRYGEAVLTAERVSVNQATGESIASGGVRIQQADQVWVGNEIRYNFKTRRMEAEQFRTGQFPVFAGGSGLAADTTNQLYTATNAFITTEDLSTPATRIRARFIKIIPGDRIVARDAVVYAGKVPVFYLPYFSRRLDQRSNHFSFSPGYRSVFGPFLLTSYEWVLNDAWEGALHLDWRERRGFAVGPDVVFHSGRWGDVGLRYYYLHDNDRFADIEDPNIEKDRDRLHITYLATPLTNLNMRAQVRYQDDAYIVREFFEDEYRRNFQPSTFVEINPFWQNYSLDVYAQPRINDFYETVERLPDIRFSAFRQQLGTLPVYYESESSVGYYRRLFPETNNAPELDYEAARGDSFHQLTAPFTLFDFLNFTPRAGGRFTYYSKAEGPGGFTEETYRAVFNTGMEVSFKASRVWPEARSGFLKLDGLRHIAQPSVNYVYVPEPNRAGENDIPMFDRELASLRLLPIEFPDYNAIDMIDTRNVLRLGFRNKLQTKREGLVSTVVDWDVYTDWRLDREPGQDSFSDFFSDLVFRPREWLSLESLVRYDLNDGSLPMSFTSLSIQPNAIWSWTLGHWYLQDDLRDVPTAWGEGNNLFISRVVYKLNENWGIQARHQFEAEDGRLEEQSYAIYRDLRSWTASLNFRLRDERVGEDDFTVAFTFSLKAFPRYGLGDDTGRANWLLGR